MSGGGREYSFEARALRGAHSDTESARVCPSPSVKHGTYIATLVEPQSRFLVLVKLSEKGTESVVDTAELPLPRSA
jgi:hypothetical protein